MRKKRFTYQTFDTADEARRFVEREKPTRPVTSWSDFWWCWIVTYYE